MSATTADARARLQALGGELQTALQSGDVASSRRHSKALSISSLSDESSSAQATKAVATEACRDVERELAAIETRLSVFRGRRRRHDSGSTSQNAVAPLQTKMATAEQSASSASSKGLEASSPTSSTLSNAQREAGEVAEQVATTLKKCDQLLQRVKSCGMIAPAIVRGAVGLLTDCVAALSTDASRVSSASSSRERSLRVRGKPRRKLADSALSDSMASHASSPPWDVANTVAMEDEEALLAEKAAAVKRFATRCQRDVETSATKIELHHQQTQAAYLKELQRKYDSKKHMALMALREKYEKETKALVRSKMEECELEEATAVKKTRATLLEERNQALEEVQGSLRAAMDESLSQLEAQLTLETERERRELSSQLQEELSFKLKLMQEDSRAASERWEVEQRQTLEQELYEHREAAVASVLKAQEERTLVLKQEIQASHFEKEDAELHKLRKALAFGAQAQLQQLRKRLEAEHDEKAHDIKTEAALALEKETQALQQLLTRSHCEQQAQLQRDLEKKTRVAVMELHDAMQAAHQESLRALKDAAEQRRASALASHRQAFEQECRQELQVLEQTLDEEMTAKLRQLEMSHAEECEVKLEQLRARAVSRQARELEAKRSRMTQCKNVLLAEATAFLTFDNNLSDSRGRSEASPEDNSAAAHLLELKKHLAKELAQYVDIMVAEFDELADEQCILVAKITESTQLYLSFKRQCGVLEAQAAELTSGLETLHDQLQSKDAVCKKLYQANEALLKRLQTPALEASGGSGSSEPASSHRAQSPASAKALHQDG